MNDPFPQGYNANSRCKYHMGAPRHMMENCKALNHKVKDLIDFKAFTFTPTGSNVRTNPMPTHVGPSINAVEESDNQELI